MSRAPLAPFAPVLAALSVSALATLLACSSSGAGSGADAGAPADQGLDATPLDAISDATPRDATDATDATDAPGAPLSLTLPGPQSVDEERELRLSLAALGGAGGARVFLEAMPPGAQWDEASGTFAFTPDFTQGGATWHVSVTADDGVTRVHGTFDVTANDSIRPPAPKVTATTTQSGYLQLTVTQTTDAFLDAPGFAGRTFTANVSVPTGTAAGAKLPVRVGLHGFASSPAADGWSGEFRIYPSDPNDTYWWGYSDQLPGGAPTKGTVPDYTARRVLHLLAWLKSTQAAVDPERVYLDGWSMGGAGAMTLGLLHARHFCHVRASFGQAIPKNHRPSRLAQLAGLWGTAALDLDDGHGLGVFTRGDLTRALGDLRDTPDARDQFLTLHHAKDDATIHFGAVVLPSPLTATTFYASLQQNHVGHFASWDEGGHGIDDPVLGAQWWTAGWDPVFDSTALLRLHQAFPAFSASGADEDPGDGKGNGRQPWSAESGYAGNVAVAGDTGWTGAIAGARNRFLRWDATRLVDTLDRFELPLRALDGPGSAPPRAGYPTTGDKLGAGSGPPVLVDVTPRRTQSFRLRPGERVAWSFGAASGTATADATGAVTIPRLALTTSWTTLVLARAH